jgi:hypothetical protein
VTLEGSYYAYIPSTHLTSDCRHSKIFRATVYETFRLENDRQTERVLKFLVKVEEDPNLRAWAADELKNFQKRIKTKNELYNEAVQTVSELVNSDTPGDEHSENYKLA